VRKDEAGALREPTGVCETVKRVSALNRALSKEKVNGGNNGYE
jgi:hypothetical protein